jgi:hypothetical protein
MRVKYALQIPQLHTLSEKKIVRICHDRHGVVIGYILLEVKRISLQNLDKQ